MLRPALAVTLFISATIWSGAQTAPAASPKLVAPLQPMLEALDRARVSGSLELSGPCDAGRPPHLPHLRALPTNSGSLLLDFRVSAELLNVKITHISFESNGVPSEYAAFSPNAALMHAILRSPEASAFMKTYDMGLPFGDGVTSGNGPRPVDSPHIVGSMDNLTVAEALDGVLRTFPGIWPYENCPQGDGTGLILRFFNLHDPGLVWE